MNEGRVAGSEMSLSGLKSFENLTHKPEIQRIAFEPKQARLEELKLQFNEKESSLEYPFSNPNHVSMIEVDDESSDMIERVYNAIEEDMDSDSQDVSDDDDIESQYASKPMETQLTVSDKNSNGSYFDVLTPYLT